jgi:hypothetical protein
MPIKIVFNGREYGDPAEMPETVRREYDQALAVFDDANRNGIPDVLENAGKNIVTIQQSSFSINGKSFDNPADLPPWARALYDQAIGAIRPTSPSAGAPTVSAHSGPARLQTQFDVIDADLQIDPLKTTTDVLTGLVRLLLVVSAVAVVIVATLMFRDMDASSASQGGRVWVVVGALVVLVAIANGYAKMSRR